MLMTFLIRYRDADHNLTKTVVTAEDSIDALVKFKNEQTGSMISSMQFCPTTLSPARSLTQILHIRSTTPPQVVKV